MVSMWDLVTSAILKIFWVAIAIFAPVHDVLATITTAVFVDMITGVWAAMKRGEKITSGGLRRTVSKLFIYCVLIGIGFLFDIYLFPLPWLVKLIGAYIGIVEMTSIVENSNVILGQNIFQLLIKKLGSHNDKEEPKQ